MRRKNPYFTCNFGLEFGPVCNVRVHSLGTSVACSFFASFRYSRRVLSLISSHGCKDHLQRSLILLKEEKDERGPEQEQLIFTEKRRRQLISCSYFCNVFGCAFHPTLNPGRFILCLKSPPVFSCCCSLTQVTFEQRGEASKERRSRIKINLIHHMVKKLS